MNRTNQDQQLLCCCPTPAISAFVCFFLNRFCRRHRLKTGENVPSIPRDLLLMSEMVLPRFILCIIQYLRDGYVEPGKSTCDKCFLCKDDNVWDVAQSLLLWCLVACLTHGWRPCECQAAVSVYLKTRAHSFLMSWNPLSCLTRQLSWERSPESPAAAGTSDLLLGGAHKDGWSYEDRVDKDLDQSANVQGAVHG